MTKNSALINLQSDFNLKPYNTFGLNVKAKFMFEPESMDELVSFIKDPAYRESKQLVLGGGSNVLFLKDFDGIVIHPSFKNMEVINENQEEAEIKAYCGEEWDEFVKYCVDREYGGIENLSLIPGNVGAAPIQNIGAYGTEVKNTISRVETVDRHTGETVIFSNHDCQFDYRTSIFKARLKNRYIISAVDFTLQKKPRLNLSYGNIKEELKKYDEINIHNLRKAIINIRESKLPDPKTTGNAGSFFKNPVVHVSLKNRLSEQYPEMPCYRISDDYVKIPAGWMIEQCGWKGKVIGQVQVSEKQALVLTNLGHASGREIYEVSRKIKADVYQKFSVPLEEEVNII